MMKMFFIALLCVTVINAECQEKDEIVDRCIKDTKVDENAVKAYWKGTNTNLLPLSDFFSCVLESKGLVQDGKVDLSSLEVFAKDDKASLDRLSKCKEVKTISVNKKKEDVVKLTKCIREYIINVPGGEKPT